MSDLATQLLEGLAPGPRAERQAVLVLDWDSYSVSETNLDTVTAEDVEEMNEYGEGLDESDIGRPCINRKW